MVQAGGALSQAIDVLKAAGDEDGLFNLARNPTLGAWLDLVERWAAGSGRPSQPQAGAIVEEAVAAFRNLESSIIQSAPELPDGMTDLFAYWQDQAVCDDELCADLFAEDPFQKARAFYLGHSRGFVGRGQLERAAASEHWPLRLVACMLAAPQQDAATDHVVWVASCCANAALLNLPLCGSAEGYSSNLARLADVRVSDPDGIAANLLTVLTAFQGHFPTGDTPADLPALSDSLTPRRWLVSLLRNRIAINARDGSVMVYVAAGTFVMGDGIHEYQPLREGNPPGYWISVFAVSNAQYKRYIDETGRDAPGGSFSLDTSWWRGNTVEPRKINHPIACITWREATDYAEWAGGGLPTEEQWEKAARGPYGFLYPWGNSWDPDRCRHAGNGDAGMEWSTHDFSGKLLSKGVSNQGSCAVYGYPSGVSSYGTYNQSGNVEEWCADRFEDFAWIKYPKPGEAKRKSPFPITRGGCWWCDDPQFLSAAYRGWVVQHYRSGGLGFRIVKSLKDR